MRPAFIAVALTVLFAGLTFTARAEDLTPCQRAVKTPDVNARPRPIGAYTVYVYYDPSKAVVGSNLDLHICIETPELKDKLKLIDCDECRDGSRVFEKWDGPIDEGDIRLQDSDSGRAYKYLYAVKLRPDIEEREYTVTLIFKQPSADNATCANETAKAPMPFPLLVGSNGIGRLSEKPGNVKPLDCTSGGNCSLQMTLLNGYSEYDVNVTSLAVSTSPARLVTRINPTTLGELGPDGRSLQLKPGLEVKKRNPAGRPLELELAMAGFREEGSFFSGFDTDAEVVVTFEYFEYKDTLQHPPVTYELRRPLRLRPSKSVSAFAIALGVAGGIFLMLVWRRLKVEGNPRRKALVIISTIFIGLIVSILALQGGLELNVNALNLRASYDKPFMLFILSLCATVSGTPLLQRFLRLDGTGAGEVPPAPAGTPSGRGE